MAFSDLIIHSTFSEKDWLIQISNDLNQDVEKLTKSSFCVFQVPELITAPNPEDYTPQLVALGPYHHLRSQLYQMERFKLAAAKRAREKFQVADFPKLIEQLSEIMPDIRACYDNYLNIRNSTIAWIMAIDGLFLLDVLDSRGSVMLSSLEMPHFLDSLERKLSQDAILRDLMVLENQIPFFVLGSILINSCCDSEWLSSVLVDFCGELSPLALSETYPPPELVKPWHLLDLLYQLIWLKERLVAVAEHQIRPAGLAMPLVFDELLGEVEDTDNEIVKLVTKPISLVLRISEILGISAFLRKYLEEEDAVIPTASQLQSVGVKFCVTKDGIRSINFNKVNNTFSLPVFTWKPNCGVIMRNLVAFEAMAKSESLILARYTELMNGIINTVEDVELLREENIILGDVGSAEVVELFNGMGKSIDRKDKTILDEAIGDVNEYYNSVRKIKISKLIKKSVKCSWTILMVLGAILLILMLALQTFCEVYSCPSITKTTKVLQSPVGDT